MQILNGDFNSLAEYMRKLVDGGEKNADLIEFILENKKRFEKTFKLRSKLAETLNNSKDN